MFNHAPPNYSCPFCRMVKSGLSSESDVVYETEHIFACISLHQHEGSGPTVLVIPKDHVENIYDISDELLAEVSSASKFIALKMRQLWNTKGITIWQHNEPEGSQDVWHFHTHIKCRLENDNVYSSSKKVKASELKRASWAKQLREHIEAV